MLAASQATAPDARATVFGPRPFQTNGPSAAVVSTTSLIGSASSSCGTASMPSTFRVKLLVMLDGRPVSANRTARPRTAIVAALDLYGGVGREHLIVQADGRVEPAKPRLPPEVPVAGVVKQRARNGDCQGNGYRRAFLAVNVNAPR